LTYETAAGLRQAVDARLNARAKAEHVDVNRLRRGLVFERVMARLDAGEPGEWVVKGGMVLEWRLGGRARATRDLDLVRRGQAVAGPQLRERLVDLLAVDAQDDRFTFEIGPPQALDVGFRFSVSAILAGKVFASVRLDVASRGDELLATETLQVPSALPGFDRLPPPRVEVASPAQHFAEKLHALTREHADRINTRVRDLVDLMLLIELKLVKPADVLPAVRHVFESRGTHPIPDAIPDPPGSWARDYEGDATATSLQAATLEDAIARLRSFWKDASGG
jgi:Nucleotidyl transferase AbiEii toxin, Type IV TA system